MNLIRETAIVYTREMRPLMHAPWALIFNLTQPLVFLLLFGPLLANMPGADAGGGGSHWQWFVPGILVMLGLNSTGGSGYGLLLEMQTGSHERLLVTPLNRTALLVGRGLKEVVQLIAQALLIILVVLPLGFRLHPIGLIAGLLLLATVGIGLGALSYALAIAVKDHEWVFWVVQQTLLFPLLILSGTFLPLESGPAWMRAVARANPLTHVVEAERALFAGEIGHRSVLYGAIAALAIASVGLLLGTRAMRRA